MENKKVNKIEKLKNIFLKEKLSNDFEKKVREITGIDLSSSYGKFHLKNPVIVAPGQLTRTEKQIAQIKEANFAGCVLKSIVGEDESGNCSMILYRNPPTYLKSVYFFLLVPYLREQNHIPFYKFYFQLQHHLTFLQLLLLPSQFENQLHNPDLKFLEIQKYFL